MKPIRKKTIFCFLLASFLFIVNSNWVMAESRCIFPTGTGDAQTPEGWYLKWDPENPDVTDQYGSTVIKIKGFRPPFTWSVSENGFALEDSQTWGLSNILYDGTGCNNCEVAEITVTDAYEESVTGYVRCRNGTWVRYYTKPHTWEECCGRHCPQCYQKTEDCCIVGNKLAKGFACRYDCGSPQPECMDAEIGCTICKTDVFYNLCWGGGTRCYPHHMWFYELYEWQCP